MYEYSGGATTLIAVLGSHQIHHIGFMYVLFPACIGSCIFVVMGIFFNNISAKRERLYPVYWLPFHRPQLLSVSGSGVDETTSTKDSTIPRNDVTVPEYYAPSEISLDEEEMEMSLPGRASSPDISLHSWGRSGGTLEL